MSNDTHPLGIGTLVYRLSAVSTHNGMSRNVAPSRRGEVQEIATYVGHTSEQSNREAWENKFGAGHLYRLRRIGGKGKGGQTYWHESTLETVAS